MKLKSIHLALAFLLVAATVNVQAEDADGRYIAVPNGSGVGIWVVDTKTGKVKLCFASGTNPQYKANCTQWSD